MKVRLLAMRNSGTELAEHFKLTPMKETSSSGNLIEMQKPSLSHSIPRTKDGKIEATVIRTSI